MLGIDVVKIDRIKKAAHSSGFLRIFTKYETGYIDSKKDRFQTMAGIFAAKEAAAKALGRGFKGLRPDQIQVQHDAQGCPYAIIGDKRINLSITHDGDYAAAIAFIGDNDLSVKDMAKIVTNKTKEILTVTKEDAIIPKRNRFSHKGDYSSVKIIGGSAHMAGAPLLTAKSSVCATQFFKQAQLQQDTHISNLDTSFCTTNTENHMHNTAIAALRSGCGLVRLCVPASMLPAYQSRVQEEMLFSIQDNQGFILFNKDTLDTIMHKTDSIVIGMGMGENPDLSKILSYLCKTFIGTLIIDADGLNALSNDISIIDGHKCNLILTPHIGEFLRLTGLSRQSDDKLAFYATEFALRHNCVVVLKSACSYITDGIKIYKNTSGSAAMAKGGSGDVLAGIIAAFAGYMTPLSASVAACYYFGKSGENAERLLGSESVLASDLFLK